MKKICSCVACVLFVGISSLWADRVPAAEWFAVYDLNKDHKLDSTELAFAQIDLAADFETKDTALAKAGEIISSLQYFYGDLSRNRLIDERAWNPKLVEQKLKSLRLAQKSLESAKEPVLVSKKN